MPPEDPSAADVIAGRALSARERRVLQALIAEYLLSGDAIASRQISRTDGIEISSATIRNVLSDLSDLELVSKAHQSSGRVPTERGLRYYVNSLLVASDLSPEDQERLEDAARRGGTIAEMIRESSRVLSDLSRHASVVLLPGSEVAELRHVDFVRLRPREILAVLVSRMGDVRNALVELDFDPKPSELDEMRNYINSHYAGLTLSEARRRIATELESERARRDRLQGQALELGARALDEESSRAAELIVEGQAHLLESKELTEDLEALKKVVEALDQKQRLSQMLHGMAESPDVRVYIGADNTIGTLAEKVSIVAGGYGPAGKLIGTVGVIGPTRMDYGRVVGLVDCTTKLLSSVLRDRVAAPDSGDS